MKEKDLSDLPSILQSVNDNFEDFCLLYSGIYDKRFSGKRSYLYYDLEKRFEIESFDELSKLCLEYSGKNIVIIFPYETYRLVDDAYHFFQKNEFIKQPKNILVFLYKNSIVFNNNSYGDNPIFTPKDEGQTFGSIIDSNFTDSSYKEAILQIKKLIQNGDIFQTNLTRKYFGNLCSVGSEFEIFKKLCFVSPAFYSMFLRSSYDNISLISSSPERFLHFNSAKGMLSSKPIKGSAPRGLTEAEDANIISNTLLSTKNKAENLMITDLMRNDIGKINNILKVNAESIFEVFSYNSISHLSSTIEGFVKDGESLNIGEVFKCCLPVGSMTGAPKIKATNIVNQIENYYRGFYSGSIGHIFDGGFDFSVIIRTIIIQNDKFEFQVGGGITALSDPEDELFEIKTKAKSILTVLGLKI